MYTPPIKFPAVKVVILNLKNKKTSPVEFYYQEIQFKAQKIVTISMQSLTSLSDGGNGNAPPPGLVGLNQLPPPEVVGISVNGSSSSCSLKRKRPAMIEIPSVLQEISTDVYKSSDIQVQYDNTVCFSDSGVGVFSFKGKKKIMEDAHKIFSTSNMKKVKLNPLCNFFYITNTSFLGC